MTVSFNETFTVLGGIGGLIGDVNNFQSTNLVNDTNYISQNFAGSELAIIDGFQSQLASAQNANTAYPTYWQGIASTYINAVILADNPLLSSTNTTASLQELIYQMQQNAQTVKQYLTTYTIVPTLVQGNGVCVGSCLTPDGLNCQMAFVEDVTILCTQDSNTSSALAGNENFFATGQVGYPVLSWQYPGGSGASVGTSAINASSADANGTLLENGDFESWAANIPANWEVLVGSAGSQIVEGNNPYTGSHNVEFVGDSSTLTAIAQTFGTDTPATLAYGTQYAFNCWVRVSATPAAGVLEISLIDGSNVVIDDEQGNANSYTLDLTGVSTSYVPFNGTFRLPQQVPSTIKLRISLSTSLSTGQSCYVDRLGMGLGTTLYPGGPSFWIFSGSDNFFAGINPSTPGDYFTLTTINSRPGNNATLLWLFDRLYGLKQLGLTMPTASSPTLVDATYIKT